MKVILWDWDNTLADTIDPLWQAFNETFKHFGMPTITREQMKIYMNSSSSKLFFELFQGQNIDEVYQIYLKHYQKNMFNLHLLPGAKEVLEWAKSKGFINLIASNKYYLILRQEVKSAGLSEYFADICGAEQFPENKPTKGFTDAVLEKYKNFDQLFVVGDGVSDILMARNYSKGKVVLVGTDPSAKEFKGCRADFYVKSLSEIPEILG